MPWVVACHRWVIRRAGRRNAGLAQVISAVTPAATSSRKAIAAMAASRSNNGWCHGEPLLCGAKKPAKAPPLVATPVHHPPTPLVLLRPKAPPRIPLGGRPPLIVPHVSQSCAHEKATVA